jgi:hypothetical protein
MDHGNIMPGLSLRSMARRRSGFLFVAQAATMPSFVRGGVGIRLYIGFWLVSPR